MTDQNQSDGANTRADVPAPITRANAPIVKGEGLVPQTLEDLYRLSVAFCASGLMPKGMNKPEQVMVAVQMGMELGLPLMSSVQNIAVINGRPSLWGDMPLALVENSGQMEAIDEWFENEGDDLVAHCKAKRKGGREVTRSWSWRDAVRARLTGKDVWKNYPKRMCQMRARSWVLKDLFPDVIKGVAIAEYSDYTTGAEAAGGPIDVTPEAAVPEPSIEEMMGGAAQSVSPPPPAVEAKTVDAEQVLDDARNDAEAAVAKAHEDMNKEPGPRITGLAEQNYYTGLANMGYGTDQIDVFREYNEAVMGMGDMDPEKHFGRATANWPQHLKAAANWSRSDMNPLGIEVDESIGRIEGVSEEELIQDEEPPPHPGEGAPQVLEGADIPPIQVGEDTAAANDIKRWIAMRSSKDPNAGFAGYVQENLEAFRNADRDTKAKAQKKWKNLYKTKPPWESTKSYTGGTPVTGTGTGDGQKQRDLVSEVAGMPEEDLDGGPDTDADKALIAETDAVNKALSRYQHGALKHIGLQAAKELKVGLSPMTLDGKSVLLARCQEIEAKMVEAKMF